MMHTAIICLGSNVEPRLSRLKSAVKCIEHFAVIEAASCCKESDDVTQRSQPYVNMAIKCTTTLNINEFCKRLSDIEVRGGRLADLPEVAIDVDLVVWDDEVVSKKDLNQPYFSPLYDELTCGDCKTFESETVASDVNVKS